MCLYTNILVYGSLNLFHFAEHALMDVSWVTSIVHRASLHENLNIRRWVLCEFMTIDLKKCPLFHVSNWSFLLGPFLKMLNDNALYSRGDSNISGDPPPVGHALASFITSSMDSLAKDQQKLFLKELIAAISHLRLQQVPLFFMMQVSFPIVSVFLSLGHCWSIKLVF